MTTPPALNRQKDVIGSAGHHFITWLLLYLLCVSNVQASVQILSNVVIDQTIIDAATQLRYTQPVQQVEAKTTPTNFFQANLGIGNTYAKINGGNPSKSYQSNLVGFDPDDARVFSAAICVVDYVPTSAPSFTPSNTIDPTINTTSPLTGQFVESGGVGQGAGSMGVGGGSARSSPLLFPMAMSSAISDYLNGAATEVSYSPYYRFMKHLSSSGAAAFPSSTLLAHNEEDHEHIEAHATSYNGLSWTTRGGLQSEEDGGGGFSTASFDPSQPHTADVVYKAMDASSWFSQIGANTACAASFMFGLTSSCGSDPDDLTQANQIGALQNWQTNTTADLSAVNATLVATNKTITALANTVQAVNTLVMDEINNTRTQQVALQTLTQYVNQSFGEINDRIGALQDEQTAATLALQQYADQGDRNVANASLQNTIKLTNAVNDLGQNVTWNFMDLNTMVRNLQFSLRDLTKLVYQVLTNTQVKRLLTTAYHQLEVLARQAGLTVFLKNSGLGVAPAAPGSPVALAAQKSFVDTIAISWVQQEPCSGFAPKQSSSSTLSNQYPPECLDTSSVFHPEFDMHVVHQQYMDIYYNGSIILDSLLNKMTWLEIMAFFGPSGCASPAPGLGPMPCGSWYNIREQTCAAQPSFHAFSQLGVNVNFYHYTLQQASGSLDTTICAPGTLRNNGTTFGSHTNWGDAAGSHGSPLVLVLDDATRFYQFMSESCRNPTEVLILSRNLGPVFVQPIVGTVSDQVLGLTCDNGNFPFVFGINTPAPPNNFVFNLMQTLSVTVTSLQSKRKLYEQVTVGTPASDLTTETRLLGVDNDQNPYTCYYVYFLGVTPTTTPVFQLTELPVGLTDTISIQTYSQPNVCSSDDGSSSSCQDNSANLLSTQDLTDETPLVNFETLLPTSGDFIYGELTTTDANQYGVLDFSGSKVRGTPNARYGDPSYLLQDIPAGWHTFDGQSQRFKQYQANNGFMSDGVTVRPPTTAKNSRYPNATVLEAWYTRNGGAWFDALGGSDGLAQYRRTFSNGQCLLQAGQLPGPICALLDHFTVSGSFMSQASPTSGFVTFTAIDEWSSTFSFDSVVGPLSETTQTGCPTVRCQSYTTGSGLLTVDNPFSTADITTQVLVTMPSAHATCGISSLQQSLTIPRLQSTTMTLPPCGKMNVTVSKQSFAGNLTVWLPCTAQPTPCDVTPGPLSIPPPANVTSIIQFVNNSVGLQLLGLSDSIGDSIGKAFLGASLSIQGLSFTSPQVTNDSGVQAVLREIASTKPLNDTTLSAIMAQPFAMMSQQQQGISDQVVVVDSRINDTQQALSDQSAALANQEVRLAAVENSSVALSAANAAEIEALRNSSVGASALFLGSFLGTIPNVGTDLLGDAGAAISTLGQGLGTLMPVIGGVAAIGGSFLGGMSSGLISGLLGASGIGGLLIYVVIAYLCLRDCCGCNFCSACNRRCNKEGSSSEDSSSPRSSSSSPAQTTTHPGEKARLLDPEEEARDSASHHTKVDEVVDAEGSML